MDQQKSPSPFATLPLALGIFVGLGLLAWLITSLVN